MLQRRVNILIVDDDQSVRDMLSIVLKKEGYQVVDVESGLDALKELKNKKTKYDLVISDIKMPGVSGIELLRKIKTIDTELPVIMITAYASANDAVDAMKLGAEDYIIKPFNIEELKIIIAKSLRRRDLEQENIALKEILHEQRNFENIVGRSSGMMKIFELIDTIAKTDSTILISGESGTGKELIARAIHNKSDRGHQRFVSINCGALPENLLESELFGHKKGAFTDAYQDKEGLFEVATGGTLFLDEIAEMSQNMQVKLLRSLQERIIRRVGSNSEIAIDVRIIAATNKDLARSIADSSFRKDLYYRLNVISIAVPPLRERKEDIPMLMNYFLDNFNKKMNKGIRGFSQEVIDQFMNYNWPGNVREVENFVERVVALEKDNLIGPGSLPPELLYNLSEPYPGGDDWRSRLRQNDLDFAAHIDGLSKKIIVAALEMNSGNLKKTAISLKLNYRSLRYLIEKYNLKFKS